MSEDDPRIPTGPGLPASVPPEKPLQPPPARRFWPSIARLLLFVVVAVLLSLGFAFVLMALPWFQHNDLALGSLVLLPAAAGATALLLTVGDMRRPAAIGLPMSRLAWQHLAFGTVTGAGLSISIIGLQWAAGWVEVQYGAIEGSLSEVVWAPSIGVGFFVIASAACAEELLFRGYGLQQLMRATHPWAAVIFSSAVFGVVHASNPNSSTVGVVNTALFGVLFGLPLLRQRSLWIPAGMHFGWNFSLACLGANISGLTIRLTDVEVVPVGPAIWSGAEYGPEASLLTTFAVVAGAVLLWRMPLSSNDAAVLWDPDLPPATAAAPGPESESILQLGMDARDRQP
jgi:membrane protease YdiL (CAAX protease family)